MNIGILGGGGIRAPIIYKMLSEFNFNDNLNEVRIFDIDSKKTEAIIKLSKAILSKANKKLNIIRCNTIEEFAYKLDAAIYTIREGLEKGRAIDERVCLTHNIIGQETTGAAGFSFAARSIPSLIQYSRAIKKESPGCILINFTNPAGIVVRALNIAGFNDVIGICDSSDAARIHASILMKRDRFDFDSEIIGLNHLSYTTKLFLNSKDILSNLLYQDEFYEIAHGPFTKEIFTKDGLFKNEYLYYYYCTEDALKGMQVERETRGEYLLKKNNELIQKLIQEDDPDKLITIYAEYLNDRFKTYMSYAYHTIKRHVVDNESEGYAEIALKIIASIKDKLDLNIPMVIPNRGTISFIPDESVVEKFCYIKNGKIESNKVTQNLPDYETNLIMGVAEYENLAAEAIVNKSYSIAEKALSIHPLVGKDIAKIILKEFSEKHSKYFDGYK